MDMKQIPFRYDKETEEHLNRVCELQTWSNKKTEAIREALKITANLFDIVFGKDRIQGGWDDQEKLRNFIINLKK